MTAPMWWLSMPIRARRTTRAGTPAAVSSATSTTAKVQVQVEVCGWQKQNATLRCVIYDPEGGIVVSSASMMPDHTKAHVVEVPIPAMTVRNPKLWDLDTPQLYTAEVMLYSNNMVVDSIRAPFGIRSIEFSKEFGFRLNGREVFLTHLLRGVGAAGAAFLQILFGLIAEP